MIKRLLCASAIGLLSACGGGTSESPVSTEPTAIDAGPVANYFSYGFRGGNGALLLSVFEGGLIYALYQPDSLRVTYHGYAFDGFFVGRTTDHGAQRSYVGTNFNFANGTASAASLSFEIAPKSYVRGNFLGATDLAGGEAVNGIYSPVSTQSTESALSRTYVATVRSVTRSISTPTVSLDAVGNLTIVSQECSIHGRLQARPYANFYNATAEISSSCPVPAGEFAGHALQSFLTGNVYLMLVDRNGANGLFVHLFDPAIASTE